MEEIASIMWWFTTRAYAMIFTHKQTDKHTAAVLRFGITPNHLPAPGAPSPFSIKLRFSSWIMLPCKRVACRHDAVTELHLYSTRVDESEGASANFFI
jgi:hypothetical protein